MSEVLEAPSLLAHNAAARSRAYLLFAQALEYPDSALQVRVNRGEFAAEVIAALDAVEASLLENLSPAALAACGSEEEFQVEYTRLFDAAAAKGACHLYEGLYGDARNAVMEECLRFYDYFGLSLSEQDRELPDYLVTQLEFLHYLAYCQASLIEQGGDAQPCRLAEADFIERHLGRWVPKLNEQLQRNQPSPYFGEVIQLLDRFLRLDLSTKDAL